MRSGEQMSCSKKIERCNGANRFEIRFLACRGVKLVKVIDNGERGARSQQSFCHMTADKSSSARQQDAL